MGRKATAERCAVVWQVRDLQCGTSKRSEECRKPQPPLLLKKVSQYTSHLYCNTPPICIAVLSVPLGFTEREIGSVRLPFVSQYASHFYRNTPPICTAVLLRKSWWLWSPGCLSSDSWIRLSEVNKRGRPSKWPPECLPSKFADFECAFSL